MHPHGPIRAHSDMYICGIMRRPMAMEKIVIALVSY